MEFKLHIPFDYNKEIERLLNIGYKADYVHELLGVLMKKQGIEDSERDQHS